MRWNGHTPLVVYVVGDVPSERVGASYPRMGERTMERVLGRFAPYLYAILRLVVGFLFACHGAQKLFGVLGGLGSSGQSAPLFSLMGLAGVIELFGGLCILLGWLTGSVAFIASGEMAVAYFMGNYPRGFWPIQNNGELAVLFCFIFLYMASVGSGVWSVDRAFGKS
jgi:putative oxidoreductase